MVLRRQHELQIHLQIKILKNIISSRSEPPVRLPYLRLQLAVEIDAGGQLLGLEQRVNRVVEGEGHGGEMAGRPRVDIALKRL